MASKSSSGDGVVYQVDSNGRHGIGPVIDGVFVPFATLEGSYVDSLVEAGKSPEAEAAREKEEGGDS